MLDLLAIVTNGAAFWLHHPHQRLERGAFACAITPQQGHHLVFLDMHGHVEQDMGIPVETIDFIDFKQTHARPSLRDMLPVRRNCHGFRPECLPPVYGLHKVRLYVPPIRTWRPCRVPPRPCCGPCESI